MAKASDNEFPKLLLVPSAAPVVPAGAVGVFIDPADGHLKRVDDAGVVTDTEASSGGGGGASLTAAVLRYSGGNIVCTTTTAWSNVAGIGTLTLTGVAAGDKIVAHPSLNVASGGSSVVFDLVTTVGGTPVNSLGNGGPVQTTPSGTPGMWVASASGQSVGAPSVPYTLQAGDLTGGNSVVLRLRHYSFGGTATQITASTVCPASISAYKVA